MFGDGNQESGYDAIEEELRRQQEKSDAESLARQEEERKYGVVGRKDAGEPEEHKAPEDFLTAQGKKRQRRNLHPVSLAQRKEHSRHTPRLPASPDDASWANR